MVRRVLVTRLPVTSRILAAVAYCGIVSATASAANGDRVYTTKFWTRTATVAILAPPTNTSPTGMFAVWVGTQDKTGSWIQAGVRVQGDGQPCVYAETGNVAADVWDQRCVRPVAYGERVRVRITFTPRHGWVAWADGVAVAQKDLTTDTVWYATSESLRGERASYYLKPGSKLVLAVFTFGS